MKLKTIIAIPLLVFILGCSEGDEEIQSDEEFFTEDERLFDDEDISGDEEISDEAEIADDMTSIVNPIIYSGVHDPAQLIEINDQLVLFASAVEWSIYNFSSNRWELKGDDIYISMEIRNGIAVPVSGHPPFLKIMKMTLNYITRQFQMKIRMNQKLVLLRLTPVHSNSVLLHRPTMY